MDELAALRYFTGDKAPEVKPVDWIVQDLLARGAGTILFGQPGESKTAHAAVLVAQLDQGLDFARQKVLGRYRTLYADLDSGWSWAGQLFRAAFRGVGIEGLPESFAYWSPLDSELEGEALDYSLEFIGPALAAAAKAHRADLVVIDSFGQFMAGDPDKGQDVSIALRTGLNPLRALGAAVLVIDHATKAARVQGASVPTPTGSQQKRAWARFTVALEGVKHEGGRAARWSVDKSNGRHFEPFLTRLRFSNDSGGQLYSLSLERIGEAGPRETAQERACRAVLARLEQGPAMWSELLTPAGGKSALSRALKDPAVQSQVCQDESTKEYNLRKRFQFQVPLRDKTLEPPLKGGGSGLGVSTEFQPHLHLEPQGQNPVIVNTQRFQTLVPTPKRGDDFESF